MELSSRQLVLLAAPLAVAYLTYSTVQGGAHVMRAMAATQAVMATKQAANGKPAPNVVRNPFSPVGAGTGGLLGAVLKEQSAAEATEEQEDDLLLTLNGTVIMPRWRFAIINGDRVVEGQRYMGLRVDRIDAERVTLSNLDGATMQLDLEIAKVAPAQGEQGAAGAVAAAGAGIASVDGAAPPDILDLLGIPKS